MRVRHFRPIGLALSLVLLSSPAFSAALRQMTIDEMTQAATEIVRGTVQSVYAEQNGRTIFTHYTIQVTERLKGPAGDAADVAIPGGRLNGVRQSFPGVPALTQGTEYLLFLWKGSSGPTQLIGLNQGEFEVSSDAAGVTEASRQAVAEMLLDGQGRQVSDHVVRMRLSDMRRQVKAAIAKGSAR